MLKKKSTILLIVLAMILTTFASGFTIVGNYPGNDNDEGFDFKHDANTSSTWYFDANGNKVSGPTDYKIVFTVSGDELSFTSTNVSIDRLSIKGGDFYRIYSGLGFSESGLTAPINENSGKPYGISHYSFDITIIEIEEPEPADVRVEKSIKDRDDGESLAGFKFVLKQDGITKYGPVTTNSSGFALFEGVDPGTYDVIELLTETQEEIYAPDKDITVTVDEDDEGLVKVEFENSKVPEDDDDEDFGSLKVHKRIEYPDGRVAANIGGGVFTVKLTGPEGDDSEERTETIPGNGEHATFINLPFGTYLLEETDIDHDGFEYNGTPRFQKSGNQNPAEVSYGSVEIEIESKGQVQYWLINVLDEDDTPPEEGTLRIIKDISNENGAEINDSTEFSFMIEMFDEDEDEWVEIASSPVKVAGGSYEDFDLPFGEYKVTEKTKSGYELDGSNGLRVTLDDENLTDSVRFINIKLDNPPEPDLGIIRVQKIVQNRVGNTMSSSIRFFFELQMLDEDDDWVTVDEGSIVGNGTLTFDELEEGEYRVREVSINSDFRLVTPNNLEVDVEDDSLELVSFTNRLRPLDIDDDDDDDRPRPRPRPTDDDEDDPVVESVTVTPDPVPQAPPVIVVEQPEPEPEIEVVEEATPLATLPRTGASDPTVFAGFGAAFMALGLYLKKKRF